jgi:hypothetical protein
MRFPPKTCAQEKYDLLNESETARSIKDTQLDLKLMTYVAKEQNTLMPKTF